MTSKGPTNAVQFSHIENAIRVRQTNVQETKNLPLGFLRENLKPHSAIYAPALNLTKNGRNLSDMSHPALVNRKMTVPTSHVPKFDAKILHKLLTWTLTNQRSRRRACHRYWSWRSVMFVPAGLGV